MTYDKTGRNIGVTFMNDDKRRSSYGQAEICFYDEYKEDFGQWRLISIDKVRLSFERLKSILSQHESFETIVDPRKGSGASVQLSLTTLHQQKEVSPCG